MNAKRKSEVVVQFGRPDPDETKISKAAEFCREHIRKSAMAILDCGRELALLKAALRSDDQRWLTAFGEDRERKLVADNPFPFTSRTADKLIRIHARLGAGHMCPAVKLPASWGTLDELAKLTDKQIEAAKDKIHPMMTRAEASKLKPKKNKKPGAPKNQTIDKAHETYMRIPESDFLREIAALIRDRGVDLDKLRNAMEAFGDE